jgi:hypothetical protein
MQFASDGNNAWRTTRRTLLQAATVRPARRYVLSEEMKRPRLDGGVSFNPRSERC